MSDTTLTVTLEAARRILYAKALELSSSWDKTKSAAVSQTIARRLGESARPETFLKERATAIFEAAGLTNIDTLTKEKGLSFSLLASLAFLISFAAGALTDKLTSTAAFINLLSFPFWGVIAWNLLIYLVLFLGAIGILRKPLFPIRQMLTGIRLARLPFFSGRLKTEAVFQESLAKLTAPIYKKETTALLHLAAIAFALGLIASLALRGFSTAFVVGWESTWFAENVAAVKNFIDWTYGLVPAIGPITALPDLSVLESIRADRLPYLQESVSAAPWLLRMMVLLVVLVIFPRFVLLLTALAGVRYSKHHVKLDASEPYFADVLRYGKESISLGGLQFVTDLKGSDATHASLSELSSLWGNTELRIHRIDMDAPPYELPKIEVGPVRTVVLLVLDATVTAEEELAGLLFKEAHNAMENREDLLYAALLDMRRFSSRSKVYPERLAERKETWTHFATQHGITLFFLEENPLELVRSMREWATSYAPNAPKAVTGHE